MQLALLPRSDFFLSTFIETTGSKLPSSLVAIFSCITTTCNLVSFLLSWSPYSQPHTPWVVLLKCKSDHGTFSLKASHACHFSLKAKIEVLIITHKVTVTGCYLSNLTSYFSTCWHLCCTPKPPVTPIPGPLLQQVPKYPCGILPHLLKSLLSISSDPWPPTSPPRSPYSVLFLPLQHVPLSNVLCNLFIYHICCLSPPLTLSGRISIKIGTQVRKGKAKQKPGF